MEATWPSRRDLGSASTVANSRAPRVRHQPSDWRGPCAFLSPPNTPRTRLSKALVARVSREGFIVDQSPMSADDPRWLDWYSVGCARSVALADVVISVFTPGLDGSTWMCHEVEIALRTPRALFLWNPLGRRIPAGMLRYAQRSLPESLEDVMAVLARARSALAHDVDALPAADPTREQQARDMFSLAS